MARGIAVLRPKGRSERVHLRQRKAVRLDVQLAADGEKGFLPEEVLAEVELPVRHAGNRAVVNEVECADAEHFTGTFSIARGDDRRVYPEEPVLVEVTMNCHAQRVAYARDGAERVRTWSQMGDLAQVFERAFFRLNRVGLGIFDPANHFH